MRNWVISGSLAVLVAGCAGETPSDDETGQAQEGVTGKPVICSKAIGTTATITATPSELKLGQTTTISWAFEGAGDVCRRA